MNFNIGLIILTFVVLIAYLRYLQIFYLGIQIKSENFNSKKKNVSVIIAARNEGKNINHLLTSLVNQSYPKGMYEIIVADDASSDNTVKIVKEFSEKWNNIHLIEVKNRDKVVSPKKNALTQAIDSSKGEIIVSTDADCIMSKYWIEAMVASFEEDTAMVAGFSKTRITDWEKASLSQKFEHIDFILMFLATAGAISSGKYFSCSGQNIAYTRTAYDQVGGFEEIAHLLSGDDVNLMQIMRRQGLKVKFAFSNYSYVTTKPADGWSQLLNQRIRWASNMKWQIKLNPEFFTYLIYVFLITFLPILVILKIWWLGLGIILVRMLKEYQFIKLGFSIFRIEKNKLKFYPIWFILQPVYILVVSILGLMDVFKWKK